MQYKMQSRIFYAHSKLEQYRPKWEGHLGRVGNLKYSFWVSYKCDKEVGEVHGNCR